MRRSLLCLLTAFALAGCTGTTGGPAPAGSAAGSSATVLAGPAPLLRLVAYDSCDDLLASVRDAAKRSVRPYGFEYDGGIMFANDMAFSATARAAGEAKGPDYSGTNTHEAGVDEPDAVKTDGKRIVTAFGDTLRVVNPATRSLTGSLFLGGGSHQLLLHGDRVLVLTTNVGLAGRGGLVRGRPWGPAPSATRVRLVDLSGAPRVTGEYEIGAALTDARQTGGTARIVVTSRPQIDFPWQDKATDAERLAANRKIIDETPLDRWLPSYTGGGESGRIDCGQVSRPDSFSGTSLVTVLSFDLTQPGLDDGAPVAVLADANTVYGSGKSLYLAHDERWRGDQAADRTELYQFDTSGPEPFFAASGSVPGWLLSQYSLSEHDGVLRVATTSGPPWGTDQRSESTVYTLRRDGGRLEQLGKIGGLGKGERIHAVRFLGPTGYVVTFRQTDPLYRIDLRDPARPKVTGELKIPGYSSYLHPVADGRLVGVGQDATDQGRVTGLQVSLFDVARADPKRLDQEKIGNGNGYSEAEHDPHAFLYWPATRLLVVPYSAWEKGRQAGALLFRVHDDRLERIGEVTQAGYPRRSLVIDQTLWVIADTGAVATTLSGGPILARVAL